LKARDHSELPDGVCERITWFESYAQRQRNWYYTAEIAVILLSAAIPAASALGATTGTAAVLGALVAIVGSVRHLFRWGQNWIRSSRALEDLRTEVMTWSAGAPYENASAAAVKLVGRVEAIIAGETSSQASTVQSTHGTEEPASP
jgi:hypothetical protein